MKNHEKLQRYFDNLYKPLEKDIAQVIFGNPNEMYGELCYYSMVKLLRYLAITEHDHFLDIGSGLGRLVFQVYLTTNAASVTGIEINQSRHEIACKAKSNLQQLSESFNKNRIVEFIHADFLTHYFNKISIVYVCSTVFSFGLLQAIGEKINSMGSVQKIISMRRIPNLQVHNFKLSRKMFLHGTWDRSACYIYTKRV